jgi:two-component system chemotaxis response regulator CheB
MILFCEECGTRHDIDPQTIGGDTLQFVCDFCHEKLIVSLSKKNEKSVQAAMQQVSSGACPDAERPLKIFIVDDSRIIRRALREMIESDACKLVIGEADNGKVALDLLRKMDPDVITLDINMPVMDGLTTLKHIMINHPKPIVMISALTQEGAFETFESLKYGAIDFMPKPKKVNGADITDQKQQIIRKLELAAGVQIESVRYLRVPPQKIDADNSEMPACDFVLAIGVAEGGYGALLNFIPQLPADLPAAFIAVMQQAPEHVDAFARYLDQCSRLSVQRAKSGKNLAGGTCYLADSMAMFAIEKKDERICLIENRSSRSDGIGAIDHLMSSVAETMSRRGAGIILTGAGHDGISGLGKIISKGGAAFVQDPKNCLYKQTALAALETYSVDDMISSKEMAGAVSAFLNSFTR